MKSVRFVRAAAKLFSVFVVVSLLLFAFGSSSLLTVKPARAANELLAPDGTLDTSFGSGGIVTTDFGSNIDFGQSVALQPDGKIIAGGYIVGGSTGADFVLARYLPDGSLDTSFGSAGKIWTDFDNRYDYGMAVALQPDGRILMAGYTYSMECQFVLVRYNSDGSLDTTFGSEGKVISSFINGDDYATSIALQPDGKIVLGGTRQGSSTAFLLARYNINGSLDTSFGMSGIVITDLGQAEGVNDIVIQPQDGKIIAAGWVWNNDDRYYFALARYNTDGSLDTTFDSDGKVVTNVGSSELSVDVALQSDGKILAAGSVDHLGTYRDFMLLRYNSNGSLDITFDSDGMVVTDFGDEDDGAAVAVQPDGRILMAGSANKETQFALARFHTDGSLDTSFGTNGKVTTYAGGISVAFDMLLQPDHKIIVVGSSRSKNLDFALARFIGYQDPLQDGWVGGVSVTSDKNIVAVGRPHIGAEVASYDGFASGSLTSYVPMLFKKAYGSYHSALYVQNISDSSIVNITIKFYDNTGVLKCTRSDTIPSLSSKGYWLPTETCDTGSLPDGWVGGAVVASDQPIVAVGRPHVGNEVMIYDGFREGSLTTYLPMLFKGAYGGSYNSAFYIQNVHVSSTANITIRYYDSDGRLKCTKADDIAPLASRGYWVPTATCDTGSLPAGWIGGVVVTSNQPIVGLGRPHIGTQVTTYNGFTSGDINSYIPMLFKNAWGSYNSAFYLQNTDASLDAQVTIKYYSDKGVLNCTRTDTIAPLASKGYWVPTATCDTGSLDAGWVGGVVVTSDQPVVGVGRPHIGAQVTTYNGFTAGDFNSYLPMLFKETWGTYNSAFYVQNTENTAATVTVKFYDTNGGLTCTRQDTVQALSTQGYWVPTVTCNP